MIEQLSQLDLIEIFNSLGDIPLSFVSQEEALKRITELCGNALGSEACTLVLLDLKSRSLTTVACTGREQSLEQHMVGKQVAIGLPDTGNFIDLALVTKGEVIERYNLTVDGQGVANPQIAQRYNLHSVLSYPLISQEKLIGYLNHFSSRPDRFTEYDKRLIATFGRQAVLIIERLDYRLTNELSLQVLRDLSQSFLSMSPDDFPKLVAIKARELLSVPTCIVWERDEQQNKLKIVGTTDDVDAQFQKIELSLYDPGLVKLANQRRVGYLSDVTKPYPPYRHTEEARNRGWVSLMSAPMWVGDRLIGMIDLYTKEERHFKDWEKELFGAFANQAALSIVKATLLRESKAQAEARKKELAQRVAEIRNAIAGLATGGTPLKGGADELLPFIVRECAQVTQATTCILRLWNRTSDRLEVRAFYESGSKLADAGHKQHSLRIGEGIAGRVALTGTAYISQDTFNDSLYEGSIINTEMASILTIPIKSDDDVIGTLSVGSPMKDAFGSEEMHLLESIMDSVPMAIGRANLADSLLQTVEATNQSESIDDLLVQLVKLTSGLMNEAICLVWLLNKDRNGFVVRAFTGPENIRFNYGDLFISNDDPGIERFLRRKHPVFFKDARQVKSHPYAEHINKFEWKSMLAMPLSLKGQVLGIIEVYSYKGVRNFTQWHRKLFETWALQAAIAIVNLRSRKGLERLYDTMRTMAEVHDVSQLFKFVLSKSLELVGSSSGWISILDPRTGNLQIRTFHGLSSPSVPPLKVGEAISGLAVKNQEPIRVQDVRDDEWRGFYQEFWTDTRAELAVPILINKARARIGRTVSYQSKPIGVINIESPTVGAFSQEDQDSVSSLARLAAIIIERLEYDRKLRNLTKFGRVIVGQQNPAQIIQQVVSGITETLGFDYVNVSLVNHELNLIQTEYVTGIPDDEVVAFKKMASHALDSNDIQADIVRTRTIEVPPVNDERFDPVIYDRFHHQHLLWVYVPLIEPSNNSVIGIIEAGYTRGYRSHIYEQDVQILQGFADYIVRAIAQEKSGLMDKISHEFRAPIAGIRNNAHYMRMRIEKLPSEVMTTKLNDIILDCDILGMQVAELEYILGRPRPISRLERTLIFRDIVIKTINQLRPLIAEHALDPSRVSYNLEDSRKLWLYVDKVKLNQVVFNLLTNAIKYAEEDPKQFQIRIAVDETRDSFKIRFQDWGIGIEPGLEEKIFEPGFRTPEAIRKNVTGSGLGLAIAKRIMHEIGGDLILANRSKPTEFALILPKSLKETSP